MLFRKAHTREARSFKSILQKYTTLGQEVSQEKSKVFFFNTTARMEGQILRILGFKKGSVDFFPDWMLIPRFPYKVAISDQQDLWARGPTV